MPRCITDYLKQKHHGLSQLLNELTDELRALPLTRDVGEAFERIEGLCQEISKRIHIHLEEEERVLYPALESYVQGISATLDRMRRDHDTGEAAEKAFRDAVAALAKAGANRQDVMRSGRAYIQWVRGHLLSENGRLFPLVERGLDPKTQREIRRAMEELSQETSAHISEVLPRDGRA
jgi:hemerythrin-like domain-containing protein